MEDEVGQLGLLERGGERVDELVGQLADEADGVGHEVGAAVQLQRARGRVERVEEAVADADVGARHGVEQRRLARVGVAGQRDVGQVRALALGAHDGARRFDVVEPPPQGRDAVAREPPVRLDLRLARASRADAADAAAGAETLEVRPQASHAGHVVLELGQLDLELAVGGVGVTGEDVEDHRGAVDHRHPERLLEVALLPRGQLVVDGDEVGVRRLEQRLELVDLAGTEVEVGMGLLAVLHELAHDGDTGRPQQFLELGHVVAGHRCPDAIGTLTRAPGRGRRDVAGRLRSAVAMAFHHLRV